MSGRGFTVVQAEDRLAWKRLALLASVAAAVGVASVAFAGWYGGAAVNRPTSGVQFVAVAPRGTVDETLCDHELGPDRVAAQRRRLSEYGWTDRSRGAVHIPIDRAIDLTAQEAP